MMWNLDSVFALVLFYTSVLSVGLLGLPFAPRANIANRVSYDTRPTFVSFSPSDSVLLPPIDDTFGTPFHPINATYTRESFIMDKIYTNPKAFGYIFPAPTWSIILHTERHGALYSMPIPKFTISYPTSFHDPVVMS